MDFLLSAFPEERQKNHSAFGRKYCFIVHITCNRIVLRLFSFCLRFASLEEGRWFLPFRSLSRRAGRPAHRSGGGGGPGTRRAGRNRSIPSGDGGLADQLRARDDSSRHRTGLLVTRYCRGGVGSGRAGIERSDPRRFSRSGLTPALPAASCRWGGVVLR